MKHIVSFLQGALMTALIGSTVIGAEAVACQAVPRGKESISVAAGKLFLTFCSPDRIIDRATNQ